jgi:hypothetical protein
MDVAQRKAIDRLQQPRQYTATPLPSAITLTRTTVLSFTANVQQAIVWESEIRNTSNTTYQLPFTWSGSVITVPQDGYYQIHFYGTFPTASSIPFVIAIVGYNPVLSFNMYPQNPKQARLRQYLFAGDTIECLVTSAVNNTLSVNSEFTASQSPILYIVRL